MTIDDVGARLLVLDQAVQMCLSIFLANAPNDPDGTKGHALLQMLAADITSLGRTLPTEHQVLLAREIERFESQVAEKIQMMRQRGARSH